MGLAVPHAPRQVFQARAIAEGGGDFGKDCSNGKAWGGQLVGTEIGDVQHTLPQVREAVVVGINELVDLLAAEDK